LVFTSKFGGTAGKILFGIRIVGEDGNFIVVVAAFFRMTAGYAASAGFFMLGYRWVFRKKENLIWYDRLFATKA